MFPNIRQTVSWEKYFKHIGWEGFRLSDTSLVLYTKILFFHIAKMQRPNSLDDKLLLELDEECKKKNIVFLKLEPNIDQDITLLENLGYVKNSSPIIPPSALYIKLKSSENSLWENVSHSGKYGINRGKREDTKVEFIRNPTRKQLEIFYKEVHLYTSKSKHFYTPSLEDLLYRNSCFKPNTYLSFVYDKDANLCGGKYYLSYDDVVFYIFGGTTDLGSKNRSGFVQMWESFLYFQKLGFNYLDLDGIYDSRFPIFKKGWSGFSSFKEKFGGTVVKYPYPYVKIYNPLLKFFVRLLRADL